MPGKSKRKIEFGDFQTPVELSKRICALLHQRGVQPASVIEPTCGEGNLLLSALDQFPSIIKALGIEINPEYVQRVKRRLASHPYADKVHISQADFFDVDWEQRLGALPDPMLVIGNPPWVTSSELATLNSANLPTKSNLHGFAGLDAKTGKSNFDISEWMLIHMLTSLGRREATMAMLCKTSVARKVLTYVWRRNLPLENAAIYLIDAKASFDASVDACLLTCDTSARGQQKQVCRVYESLSEQTYQTTFGYRDRKLIANVTYYDRWRHLAESGKPAYRWRSGIKHDCSKVMELTKLPGEENSFRNKLGEIYHLETDFLYPMLKSSDVANAHAPQPTRWMLVTQQAIGEETLPIKYTAPKTWSYLMEHADLLAQRKSSVYQGQPRFSIFGVGAYAFAPWKVAISGMYKRLHFALVGPHAGKPVVLDDTCYFLPCQSEAEAQYLIDLLSSEAAEEFLKSFIFWDAKRPIKVSVLSKLNLAALARELDTEETIDEFLHLNPLVASPDRQLALFHS